MIYRKFDQLNKKKLKDNDYIELLGRVFEVRDIVNGNDWLNFEEFLEDAASETLKCDWDRLNINLQYINTKEDLEIVALVIMAIQEKLNIEIYIDKQWQTVLGNPIIVDLGELEVHIGMGKILFLDEEETYLETTVSKIKALLPKIIELKENDFEDSIDVGYGNDIERESNDRFCIGCKTIYLDEIKELQKVLAKL